ncbi:hypothetical protein [Sphingopyxis sp.]|jgi:hypothetical protein|uniref:hypothetical protein n=1 Tax=Sphingopyxis sp. TaxID=1908224 RepID=UPI002DFADAF2|nr:hypothetical protein [Sphingopyxis sp.]
MLSMMQAAALMLTATTGAPAGCPADATVAEAIFPEAMKANGLTADSVQAGKYAPVAVPVLGGTATEVFRITSGRFGVETHLWRVQFTLPGTLADFQDAFLNAHAASKKFKVDCTDTLCSWRPVDMNDLNADRIGKLVPEWGLYMAALAPKKSAPGSLFLDCTYRGI